MSSERSKDEKIRRKFQELDKDIVLVDLGARESHIRNVICTDADLRQITVAAKEDLRKLRKKL